MGAAEAAEASARSLRRAGGGGSRPGAGVRASRVGAGTGRARLGLGRGRRT